jgi:NAD(P)-dependent dehydrogenase (short-subunit alcohol dehydrogenase family)
VDHFSETLSTPHHGFPGAESHHLELSGLILAPDTMYPTGLIQDLTPELWSDSLSAKVLSTINVTRTFLPLVAQRQSRILMLTPSIINALNPPLKAIESVAISSLEAFARTLRREARPFGVSVSQIKMGSIDFGYPSNQQMGSEKSQADEGGVARNGTGKRTHPRELHYAVFDALTMRKPFLVRRVGRGSWFYDMIGLLIPATTVDRMLNVDAATGQDLSRSTEGWEKVDSHLK